MSTTTTTSTAPPRHNAETLFDSVGPSYETAFATCTPQQESVTWLLQHLPPHSSVLDIGCGTGRPVASRLAAAAHKVHGIDVSSSMIAAATSNVPAASFEKIDVKDFNPPTGVQYDAVTVYFSLIASVSQAQIADTFRRVYSWLKDGGIFVFATVPIDGENMEIQWMGRDIVATSLSREKVLREVKGCGFEVVKEESSKFLPKAVEAGICKEDEIWEEEHLFVFARK